MAAAAIDAAECCFDWIPLRFVVLDSSFTGVHIVGHNVSNLVTLEANGAFTVDFEHRSRDSFLVGFVFSYRKFLVLHMYESFVFHTWVTFVP